MYSNHIIIYVLDHNYFISEYVNYKCLIEKYEFRYEKLKKEIEEFES
jgi:hypothetical protein